MALLRIPLVGIQVRSDHSTTTFYEDSALYSHYMALMSVCKALSCVDQRITSLRKKMAGLFSGVESGAGPPGFPPGAHHSGKVLHSSTVPLMSPLKPTISLSTASLTTYRPPQTCLLYSYSLGNILFTFKLLTSQCLVLCPRPRHQAIATQLLYLEPIEMIKLNKCLII